MVEKRRHRRALTLKTGKITTAKQSPVSDCALLEVTDAGACLLVPDAAAIPTTFTLTVDGTNTSHNCNVAWKSRNRIGVSFLSTSVAYQG